MKKLFYLISLLWCCAYLQPLFAQSGTTCNAEFSFTLSGHTASFHSLPNLAAGTADWWTFGDATTSDNANPTHTYASAGTYWVIHYILNQATNCKDSFVRAVTVTDSINCTIHPEFSWRTDSANCRKIIFTNQSTPISPNVHFVWKFGDGTTSNDINPSHVYAKDSVYNVCLVIESGTNCRKEVCKQVEVRCETACNIEPAFTWKRDSSNCRRIIFTNLTAPTSATAHYIWKFGDGTTSNDVNPSHVYAQEGNYTVCLVVETANNCRKEVCKQVEVRCDAPCNIEPAFTWKRDSSNCKRIIFTNLTAPTTTAAHFIWKFGDGTSSNDVNPSHVYAQEGNYTVCLVIETANNCRKEVCKVVEVRCPTPPPICNVHAKFEWRRDSAQWNKVWFNNLSQPIPNIWRTYWSYGDGTSSQDFNSYHIYPQPGKYYVCLKVQSLNGCTDTYCDSVIVRKPETCEGRADYSFEVSANNLLEYRFKPKYINQTWKYYWSFGDGTSSTAIQPVHKYPHAGTFKVCLTVVNGDSCRATTCKEIRVALNCDDVKVKFEYTRNQEKPYIITFHASGNLPIIQQTWTITKLSNTTIFPPPIPVLINGSNPTYTFRDSGWYMVCLYAITINNCKRTYCERIYIEHGQNGRAITGSSIPVYPNPATRLVKLDVQVESNTLLQIRVIDGTGSLKMQFVSPARAGNNNLTIPVEKLSSGLYVVEIRYGNQLKLAKFQKS